MEWLTVAGVILAIMCIAGIIYTLRWQGRSWRHALAAGVASLCLALFFVATTWLPSGDVRTTTEMVFLATAAAFFGLEMLWWRLDVKNLSKDVPSQRQ